MVRSLATVLFLLLVPVATAWTQGLPEGTRARVTLAYWPATRLGLRYPEGDRYRIFEGTILRVDKDSLTVEPAKPRSFESSPWTVAHTNVYRLEISGGRGRSTTKGLVYGVLAGVIIGTAVAFLESGVTCDTTLRYTRLGFPRPVEARCQEKNPVQTVILSGATGAFSGAAIGGLFFHDLWRDVDHARLRVSVVPDRRRPFQLAVSIVY